MCPFQAAWFRVHSGSGGLKCQLANAEGTVVVDAAKATVTIKVQGRGAAKLRGALRQCLHSTIAKFSGVRMVKEAVVCGVCQNHTSIQSLYQRVIKGLRDFECDNCKTRSPITDLHPDPRSSGTVADKHKLICEWMEKEETAKRERNFLLGRKAAFRNVVPAYLSSFLPTNMRPRDSPPLLWLPQISSIGYVTMMCFQSFVFLLFTHEVTEYIRIVRPHLGPASVSWRCRRPLKTAFGTPPRIP